jgi:hypothetical protein
MAMGRAYDLPSSVELWDDKDRHVEELIAFTGGHQTSAGRTITVRQKTRLLADSRRERT